MDISEQASAENITETFDHDLPSSLDLSCMFDDAIDLIECETDLEEGECNEVPMVVEGKEPVKVRNEKLIEVDTTQNSSTTTSCGQLERGGARGYRPVRSHRRTRYDQHPYYTRSCLERRRLFRDALRHTEEGVRVVGGAWINHTARFCRHFKTNRKITFEHFYEECVRRFPYLPVEDVTKSILPIFMAFSERWNPRHPFLGQWAAMFFLEQLK